MDSSEILYDFRWFSNKLNFFSRYYLNYLKPGTYEIRVMAVSLAGNGPFSDFHTFRIIKQENASFNGWIFVGIVIVIVIICIAAILYYCKHRILLMMRRQNDTIVLMQDIEPTDFHEMSLHHNTSNELSDIEEFDD